ncbi:MAG: phenylalanine--tRNA ligase subunit beta, partial [Terrimesophilobacter sp.]
GGERTEITISTVNVLIEAAGFDPISVARSARRHKLPSEASKRFERGVDPAVAAVAAARAVELLVELAGGTAEAEAWQVGTIPQHDAILLPAAYVNSIIGADFATEETVGALREIGATVVDAADGHLVTPPSWRPDLKDQADLTEEVTRILGYDRIPSVLPTAPPGRGLTRGQRFRRSVSNSLAANGLTEVLVYPFVSAEQLVMFAKPGPAVALANPMDGTAPFLRTSLLPGLVTVAQRNLSRGLTDIAIFELGSVYRAHELTVRQKSPLPAGTSKPSDVELQGLNDSIPEQPLLIAALFTGQVIDKQPGMPAQAAGLSDALTAAHQVAAAVGAKLSVHAWRHPGLHPGRTAALYIDETLIGVAGEVLPALAREVDLPQRVAVMELNLSQLMELAPREVSSRAIATLPAATQDLSVVVAASVPAGEVLTAVKDGAGALLEHIALVDDYRGTGVEPGTKSLTFALRFRATDRTLTAAEATGAKLAGVAAAAEKCGAVLRE